MNSLYLTEIKHNNPNTTREKETDKIQDLYLRYLLNEETIFADIDKIEACYLKRSIENSQKFNINKSILHEKEETYNSIILQLMNEMFLHYEIQKKSLMAYYKTKISRLKAEIRMREHQNETYQNNYNRLYHSNYMIKKRLYVEQRFESICSKQESNYKILKQHAVIDLNKKQKMLSEIIEYNYKVEIENRFNQKHKGNKISELEFSVNMIKKDIISMVDSLKAIKAKSSSVQKVLNERRIMNEKEVKHYYFKFKEFHKRNTQLLSIFEDLKVDNLDNLILKFIEIKGELQTLHSVFGFENKEMQLLNNEYTQLKDILNAYKSQMRNRNNNKQNSLDNMSISKQLTKINKQRFKSDDIESCIHKKLLLLQLILSFLFQSIRRFLPEIQIQTMTNNSNILRLLRLNSTIKLDKFKIDNNLVKITCSLLLVFSNSFFLLLYRSFNVVISHETMFYSSEGISSNTNGVVYHLYKKDYLENFKELANKAMLTLESKIRLIKKNEHHVLLDMNKKKAESSTLIYRQGISQRELFSSFIDHIESKNKEMAKINSKSKTAKIRNYLIENHPRKIMSFVGKYQNELVFKEKREAIKSMQATRNKTFINKSMSCPLTLKKKQQSNAKEHTQSTYDKDDSYDKHQNDDLNIGKNSIFPRLIDINDEKEQTAKIYKRLNDIRNLELKYKEHQSNNELKELYLFLQNKYSKLGEKRKRNTSTSLKTLKKSNSLINEERKTKNDNSFYLQANKSTTNQCINNFPFVSRNQTKRCTKRVLNKTFFSAIIK